jgi:hypothetical protein
MRYEKPAIKKEGELKTEAQILRSSPNDIVKPIP